MGGRGPAKGEVRVLEGTYFPLSFRKTYVGLLGIDGHRPMAYALDAAEGT